ncbi:hypothetical protein Pint_10789 [Pistacia integerrima]|uniref:Uncharacterized protein n=1 Tax=Pistacia integerrima TaxID=434235 RepID=A0ACC0XL74_9ROSI|nr:hypothetical protein Pint_10789 [Pistacia integerrima]
MVKARVQDCEKTNLRRGSWSPEEDQILIAYIRRHGIWNWAQMPKWCIIASRLPGRTDNEIKNYWHTRLNKKRLKNKRKPTTETQTAAIRANQKHSSEGGSSSINAPYASNFDNYKASPMSSKLSTDDYSSLSSDPTSEIYQKQILEEKIDLFEAYRELQSLLEQSFSMEGLYMDEGYGATGPGFMGPTSQGEFSDEELQNLLEQPFPVEGLDMMDGHGAKDPGFAKPISQGGLSEELQNLLEQPFPVEGSDMMEGHGAKDPGFVKPISQGGFSEELQILLDQPLPMENLGLLEGYGATNPGSMVSTTPQVGFLNEEFRSLMERPFPIESLYGVEGYEAIKDLGIEESTSQKGLQEDPYPFASNYDGGNDLWPYFLMEVNDNGM